jgi:hypothetical protein
MRSAPPARPAPGPARLRRTLVPLLGLALLLGLGLPWGPAPPAQAAGPERTEPEGAAPRPPAGPPDAAPVRRSTRDLGNLICAPYASYCSRFWRQGMLRGAPFNLLIAETCLWVFHIDGEDAGIACAEAAIRAVPRLPDTVLVQGQFGPGERERHRYWRHQTDQQWARVATAYLQRIPNFCDQTTPVIYEYFPCLVREVQFFQTILKNYERFWPSSRRS